MKGIPDPPADSPGAAPAEVNADVPAGMPLSVASNLGRSGSDSIRVAVRSSTTDRRGDPRRLNSKTNQRSGNRLPDAGLATARIPCCSIRNCGGSGHHHFGSSSSPSDLLISWVRRRNCPVNLPTAQPSPNRRRGSRQSPGGTRSPKHSWFHQTAVGKTSPLSINPSVGETP